MKPLMYRQRPAYPALVAAACALIIGMSIIMVLKDRLKDGIGTPSSILLTGCISCGIAAVLIVSAFARYQFTHLWKKPNPALAKDREKDPFRGRS